MEPMKWGDHCIGLVCSLAELYKNTEFIDCELDTEGGLLSGHKVILAACSPYLMKLLLEHQGTRIVPLKEVKYQDMKYILDFIYFGEVGVPVTGMASFVETANFLKISSLRSCLSPNAFRRILSEVPVEQIDRSSGSRNNIDLLTNNEESSQGSREMCDGSFHFVNVDRDYLETDSESENNSTNEVEQVSCRVNDQEMVANFSRIRVIDQELLNKFNDNSREVSHCTSYSPPSPVSVKIEEDDNLNDLSDSNDPNLNVEEYSYSHNEASEETVEEIERDCECESRIKSKNGEGIDVCECSNQDTENTSVTRALETKSCSDQALLVQDVDNGNGEAQSVELTFVENKIESDDLNQSGLHYYSTSPSAKELLVKESFKEEMESYFVSHASSSQDENVSTPSMSSTNPKTEKISKPYRCDVCESSFKSEIGLKRHLGTHMVALLGGKLFSCDFCDKTFKQRSYLMYHMRTHTGEKPYACGICPSAYRNKSKLNVHMRSHTGEKPYSCSACGKSFFLKHHLARHFRSHTGEKPYQCMICDKAFYDDGSLSAHQRTTHFGEKRRVFRKQTSDPEDKPFSCSVCQKAFARKVYLQTHMVTHNGNKSFLCSTCGKAFAQKSALNLHSLTHTGVKSHLCSVCGKSFLIRHQLRRHMLTHTGDKPHPCGLCEKHFSDKGNLKAHIATHTGAKHYRCRNCDEAFNLRSDLKKHSVIHKEKKSIPE